jgi:hypothetical protein
MLCLQLARGTTGYASQEPPSAVSVRHDVLRLVETLHPRVQAGLRVLPVRPTDDWQSAP